VDAWNAWRDENPDINEADLIGANLREANLRNLLPSASPMGLRCEENPAGCAEPVARRAARARIARRHLR
jgi:hypothetical protein